MGDTPPRRTGCFGFPHGQERLRRADGAAPHPTAGIPVCPRHARRSGPSGVFGPVFVEGSLFGRFERDTNRAKPIWGVPHFEKYTWFG